MSNSAAALYRRADSAARGRHLVAASPLEQGRLIFAERPLLALQSLENVAYNQVCHGCKTFVGGPVANLRRRRHLRKRAAGSPTTASLEEEEEKHYPSNHDDAADDEDGIGSRYTVVSCRKRGCGHVYCSPECERDTWATHHYCLCTADCASDDHPLVQYKQYAVETNEILLLVAEWWVAQHTTARACETEEDADETNEALLRSYTDFVMNPWWDVLTADLLEQPGGFGRGAEIQQQLHQVCEQAASLLTRVVAEHHLPPLTARDVAVRIGACEQNAMGIRQRSPLCRDVFRHELRRQCHGEIIECLEETGFIGSDDGDDDDDEDKILDKGEDDADVDVDKQSGDAQSAVSSDTVQPQEDEDAAINVEAEEIWAYTVDEIASYLSNLFMDEDRSVVDKNIEARMSDKDGESKDDNDRDQEYDDLDLLFPPLDGTAMYSIACKMNHSCDPNVIAVYKRRTGWGVKHPLTVFAVALKDIKEGDELTISYIDAQQPIERRQTALKNYGFECRCEMCKNDSQESKPSIDDNKPYELGNDLFGSDSEDSEDELIDGEEDVQSVDDKGETVLQIRLGRLDTVANHSRFGTIPLHCLGPLAAFIHRTVAEIAISKAMYSIDASRLLKQCAEVTQTKDYCMCRIVGRELEALLYAMLKRDRQWPSISYRKAYWCGCLTAALASAHEYNFVYAQNLIDKALMLGLSRSDDRFIDYVETHAVEVCTGPLLVGFSSVIDDYDSDELKELIQERGLSRPIQFPIEEIGHSSSFEDFRSQFLSKSKPVVIRGIARCWPAVSKWRKFHRLARKCGHRLVPIELGSMLESTMKEEIMTLRTFTETFLSPSASTTCWSLLDCYERLKDVAYLAQHPLLDQIHLLQFELDMKPRLCGPEGPSQVFVWIGTGGTRSPLHFDSYDNFFVQLVGAKYIRLYSQEETPYLYVNPKSAFGLQGNMSDLDCEQEDFNQHPKSKSANYTEVLLFPGDSLFIPSRTWHYVRSLSTSVSVNYWY